MATRTKILARGIVLGAALALAGCSSAENTALEARDLQRSFPIAVNADVTAMPLGKAEGAIGAGPLSAAERGQLDGFAADFLQRGGATIDIVVPKSAAGAPATRLDEIRRHLMLRGVKANEIRVRENPLADGKPGPIVVSYERYSVRTMPCGNFTGNAGYNPSNILHSNFGCSVRHNLAQMVANPADLAKARVMSPPDGVRRSMVLQAYRAGDSTLTSAVGDTSSAAVSQFGN